MASDVDLHPQVLDGTVWHQRPTTDTGDGPVYPTRCGKSVKTFQVDEAHGKPEEWQTRCADGCYPKAAGK